MNPGIHRIDQPGATMEAVEIYKMQALAPAGQLHERPRRGWFSANKHLRQRVR